MEARRAEKRPIRRFTVRDAVEGCFEALKAGLKGDGEAGRWLSPLSVHVLPKIGTRPIEELDQLVLRSLLSVDTVTGRALRLLMLTLARTSEVRLATRDEFKGDLWELPAARTKTGVARRIPLVRGARDVLSQCPEYGPLFPAFRGAPISDAAMAAYMKRAGHTARPHGFRATFRTWAEEQTDAPFELKESVLGHAVDRGIVGAYQRSDRLEARRDLLNKWEAFLIGC